MSRRLLVVLIALVGTAGVVVALLALFFREEDRTTLAQAGQVRSVEIDVEAGRVEVVPGGGPEAMITRTRHSLVGAPETSESLVEGVLRIQARCDALIVAGCAVDYRVEAPAGVPIRVRTERASVSITDMSGMVEVDAGAGNVRLTRTRGPLKVDTSAGNVEGVDIVAQFLDMSLPATAGGYRVAADAGAGKADVSVEQNEGAGRAIMVTTSAGHIRIHSR